MIVDLFAGPGGWDHAARALGYDPVGFEYDADACATRTAAGHRTIRADLANYLMPSTADIEGIIGSPPCPLFSAAGKREGVDWLPHLCQTALGVAALSADAPPEAALSLVPLDWTLRHRPEWVTLEQVPAVLPLWEAVARRLRGEGYSAWAGVLSAADFGVPQTRRRAVLIASRVSTVQPPAPTHAEDPHPSLFGPPVERWVSAWDALDAHGITPDASHINTGRAWKAGWHLGFARLDDRGDSPDGYRQRDRRPVTKPSFALTEKARSWEWTRTRPATTIMGDPRMWPPGHKINADDRRRLGDTEAQERYGDRAGTEAVRLTIEQALVLQTFPPYHPVAGSKTSQFRQVGNAVPPLLADAVLRCVLARGTL